MIQQFRFVQRDRPTGKTHTLAVWVKYPLKESLIGLIEWSEMDYGYMFNGSVSCATMGTELMREIAQILEDLNNDLPCKYISTEKF